MGTRAVLVHVCGAYVRSSEVCLGTLRVLLLQIFPCSLEFRSQLAFNYAFYADVKLEGGQQSSIIWGIPNEESSASRNKCLCHVSKNDTSLALEQPSSFKAPMCDHKFGVGLGVYSPGAQGALVSRRWAAWVSGVWGSGV